MAEQSDDKHKTRMIRYKTATFTLEELEALQRAKAQEPAVPPPPVSGQDASPTT